MVDSVVAPDSFRIQAKLDLPGECWYNRLSVHTAFDSLSPSSDPAMCHDILIAMGSPITASSMSPEILLVNPGLIHYPEPGSRAVAPPRYKLRDQLKWYDPSVVIEMDDSTDEEDFDELAKGGETCHQAPGDPLAPVPTLTSWIIKTRGSSAMSASMSSGDSSTTGASLPPPDLHSLQIKSVALSPGGAEYIIGVGEYGSIIVHRLKGIS